MAWREIEMIQLYAHTDRLYTNIQDLPALGFIGVERLYFSSEVDAALAAKDAEIGVLRESLRSIAASLIKYGQHHAICEFMNSRRACTCGFMEATDYASQEHSSALSNSSAANPDAARLDKLPQCFHMLRFRDCQWHFTFDTNRHYYSLRDAIDAYSHPAVPGIDQGQVLAACGAVASVLDSNNHTPGSGSGDAQ